MTYSRARTQSIAALALLATLGITSCSTPEPPTTKERVANILANRDESSIVASYEDTTHTTKSLNTPKYVATEPKDTYDYNTNPEPKPEPKLTQPEIVSPEPIQPKPEVTQPEPTQPYTQPEPVQPKPEPQQPSGPMYDWMNAELAAHGKKLPANVTVLFTEEGNCGGIGGGCTITYPNGGPIYLIVSPASFNNGTQDHIFWHEYAHTLGIRDECQAERYSQPYTDNFVWSYPQCVG